MCDITACTGQVYINNNILGKERERERRKLINVERTFKMSFSFDSVFTLPYYIMYISCTVQCKKVLVPWSMIKVLKK